MKKRSSEYRNSDIEKLVERAKHRKALFASNKGKHEYWSNRNGSWKRENSLLGLLFPVSLLVGLAVALISLDLEHDVNITHLNVLPRETSEPDSQVGTGRSHVVVHPEDVTHGDTASASLVSEGNEPSLNFGVMTDHDSSEMTDVQDSESSGNTIDEENGTDTVSVNADVGGEAITQGVEQAIVNSGYPGDELLKYAQVPEVEIPVAEIRAKTRHLLNTLPLDDWQRVSLGEIVNEAVVPGMDEQSGVVMNKILVSPQKAEMAVAENSIILVDGPVRISSGSNNIVVSSGDIRIASEGKKGGSLIVSKGEVSIAGAFSSTIYAKGGLRVSAPTGVTTFNTPSLDLKDYNNTTVPPLFSEQNEQADAWNNR